MVPRDIVVRGDLPRSPNGKFDRNLLRQELTA
jgi:acyl-CoA synthetase (AMP-forming)/AMP-acid ligase II